MREITSTLRWYEDLFAWAAIFLVGAAASLGMYFVGKYEVVESCKHYGAYVISDKESILCVVKPMIKENQGELQYLRPNGKKAIHV